MIEKFNTVERRTRILEFLRLHKHATRKELSERFGVCVNTIVNDLYAINGIAPIYTQRGNGGGIYILPEYRSHKNYLTDAEENFLYSLMPLVSNEGFKKHRKTRAKKEKIKTKKGAEKVWR